MVYSNVQNEREAFREAPARIGPDRPPGEAFAPEVAVEFLTAENLVALLTLASLEIVLGIDNIVFISILTGKLDRSVQNKARRLGLFLAMFMRIALLLAISWIMKLTAPFFELLGHAVSGRDLILLGGGLFLIGKSTFEIHENMEAPKEEKEKSHKAAATFFSAIVQILLLDLVFSLDSVITAVGMAKAVWVMIVAIVLAVLVMMIFAAVVGDFIERHPSIRVLALAFLLLIGVMLVAEGMGKHIERGYIYFAMGFSLLVELLNMRASKARARHSR
jgi:predicted tellurium resistance membrane protein TerC